MNRRSLQAVCQIAPCCEMRKQAQLLKHVPDGPLGGRDEEISRLVLPDGVAEPHISARGSLEPRYAAKEGRLSRARGAEDRGHTVGRHLQIRIEVKSAIGELKPCAQHV